MHGCDCPHGACTCGMPAAFAPEGIRVTLNPEARVSVTLAGAAPRFEGGVVRLPVSIVNEGTVTSVLEAALVDDETGLQIEFPDHPLTGRDERRELRVRSNALIDVDITVAFRLRGDYSDLGGRDRIHFLARSAPRAALGRGAE